MKTYSAAGVAAEIAGDSMKDPEGWLVRQIKARRVAALKVGRKYRFTEEQRAAAIEKLTVGGSVPTPAAEPPIATGRPSAASLRGRLAS